MSSEPTKKRSTYHTELTRDQEQAYLSAVREHKSIFITGPAGTGKSFLLKKMIAEFQRQSKQVATTSMTGISASLLPGGYTFHYWLGMKYIADVDERPYDELKSKVIELLRPHDKRRIAKTDVLIIDEISMMPYYMFGLLNDVARTCKKNMKLAGGIQVIAIGDFHQLPPVRFKTREEKYVFQHPLWEKMFPMDKGQVHMLHQIVRQKDDECFRRILADIRAGKLRLENERILCGKIKELSDIPDTVPRLYAVKRNIDEMNLTRLAQLEGDSRVFSASLTPKIPAVSGAGKWKFPADTLIVEKLALKVGALVMFNKNITLDSGRFIANGQCGTVVDLCERLSGMPVVEYTANTGETMRHICRPETWEFPLYSIGQLPLMLAWNISIHKSQGSTLDRVAIDIGDTVFEYGQMYVALSRCRSLDGLTLIKFQPGRLRTDPLVKEFYARLMDCIEEQSMDIRVFMEEDETSKKVCNEEDLDSLDRAAIAAEDEHTETYTELPKVVNYNKLFEKFERRPQ
jgi:ATP-dependent DNA helicase PIF1